MNKIKKPLNQPPLNQPPLFEALEYKDMEGMLKPTIHVDEFASKMGDDDDIIVLSFFVRDAQASEDLMNWFEKGYDWVLDSDRSPGEISSGRYLVYVEMRRRSRAAEQVQQMLDDLGTLTEHDMNDWEMTYKDTTTPFSREEFQRLVPLSPKEYRERSERGLNEMRVAAGLPVVSFYEADAEIRTLQNSAGI